MESFKIGINMAGAVSAGAYTAGVLDFLIQALDEWYAAKARSEAVPMHDVSIEVLSGASAGGMCAAIGGVALHEQFPPVEQMNPSPLPTGNKLYSSWVQEVDIAPLLQTVDLENGGPVMSILDSTVLPQIAGKALVPGTVHSRKYVSGALTLFLTLTNLRGIVYDVDPANNGAFEERIAYYADQLRFEMVANAGNKPKSKLAKPLPLVAGGNGAAGWQLLQTAALATGAFPLALASRVIERDRVDYDEKEWTMMNTSPTGIGDCQKTVRILPDWGATPPAASFATVNVDGGTTDNDPFELAHDYLINLPPRPESGHANREAVNADRAVITIAPFPGVKSYDPGYDAKSKQGLVAALFALLDALIAQSRFQGESIQLLKQPSNYSRFMIAPRDDQAGPAQPALMSSSLGAFGGFLHRPFRDRDYQLGRRNCQYFLKEYFVLEADNPIIAAGLPGDVASRTRVVDRGKASNDARFARPNPAKNYIPIIPLCGRAAVPVGNPGRPHIAESVVKIICGKAADRLGAVVKAMLQESSWGLRTAASLALFLFKGKISGSLQDIVMKDLGALVDQGK